MTISEDLASFTFLQQAALLQCGLGPANVRSLFSSPHDTPYMLGSLVLCMACGRTFQGKQCPKAKPARSGMGVPVCHRDEMGSGGPRSPGVSIPLLLSKSHLPCHLPSSNVNKLQQAQQCRASQTGHTVLLPEFLLFVALQIEPKQSYSPTLF